MPTARAAVEAVYVKYMSGSNSAVRAIHRQLFRSSVLAWSLFRTKVHNPAGHYVMDLTTVLLASVLRRRLRRDPNIAVLELGAGRFAIPAGYLSRLTAGAFDAVDIDEEVVSSCSDVAQRNGFAIRVGQSDLFASVPEPAYDLIYWNLPYYRDPELFGRLFRAAPDYMSPGGLLVVGYNAMALPRERLLELLSDQPHLRLTGVKTWWWNRHEILVIRRT